MGTLQVGGTTLATKNVSTGKVDLSTNYRPPPGGVIEQFMSPCDGSSITVQSGTYTVQNVTSGQNLTTSYTTLNGSLIDYTPPSGTQTVIYNFNFQYSYADAHNIAHIRLYLDNDSGTETEVTDAKVSLGAESYHEGKYSLKWAFHIGGSNNDATGRRSSWSSARTIQLKVREYSGTSESSMNVVNYWDGSGSQFILTKPLIGITALG